MQFRALNYLLAFLLSIFVSACSGGGDAAADAAVQDCGSGAENLFCLTSCNLGCTLVGCSINQVAQNEQITLIFSRNVDPFSVPPHRTSILLRTATGEEPFGDWVVQDNRVTFLPGVLISGASTFFGFKPNETYTLHLPAGDEEPDVVTSLSGDRLSNPITCPLNIGGIRDLNQVCPTAKLLQPTSTTDVALDTTIVIEFNEIIDPSIFDGITPESSPIRYTVRPIKVVNGLKVCNSDAPGVVLPGLPRITIDQTRGTTVAIYKPAEPLPGDKCIQVEITAKVRDLAGVPACAHVLSFTTIDKGRVEGKNVEDFANSQFIDRKLSAGTWGGGQLTFSPIGGSGVHGTFDPSLGVDISPPKSNTEIWEWNTDSMKIPGSHTTTGKDIIVTDGRFFFASLEIPDGVEVHFVGSNPARIWVRGSVTVGGLLAANGETLAVASVSMQRDLLPQPGEKGGKPGCFGGAGGAGADRGSGDGILSAAYNGSSGEDLTLLSGHAYFANTAKTGGQGSPQYPASNKSSDIGFGYFGSVAMEMNRGGGGGGFAAVGGVGMVRWDAPDKNNGAKWMATGTTPGGVLMPFPSNFPAYTNGFTHQDHFLAGGSGGGGGGSAPSGSIKSIKTESYWRIGRAGGGGGGALALRTGGALVIEPSGRITAEGGAGAFAEEQFTTRGMMTPGGGGAGGALFLQVNLETQNRGLISVKGGAAGVTKGKRGDSLFESAYAAGGAGANGILHFEVSGNPSSYPIGSTVPAAPPIAKIDPKDVDDEVAVRSLWYAASLLFPPDFTRYEIVAMVNGARKLYSDDPNHQDPDFAGLALGSAVPIQFSIQGAKLERDATGKLNPKPGTAIPAFRRYVSHVPSGSGEKSLADDGATGYRFELGLDRSLGLSVEVESITIYWKL